MHICRNVTATHFDRSENLLLVVAGSKRLQLFPPSDATKLYPSPNPTYHSCEVKAFTPPAAAPAGHELYRAARPVSVDLSAGESLYLPAFWYHGVTGGDDFNAILAWWAAIHPNKRDGAGARAGCRPGARPAAPRGAAR